MKPGAYFINTRAARWSISRRWPRRCEDKHLAGAAVDVFPDEPESNAERFVTPAAGPRQRDPDAARRRLDRGGAGAHRRRGRAQVRRVFATRRDHRRGELPAGAAAAAARRHALHPRAPQRARRARPPQRRVRPARASTSPPSTARPTRDRLRRVDVEGACTTPRACWPTSAPSPARFARACASAEAARAPS